MIYCESIMSSFLLDTSALLALRAMNRERNVLRILFNHPPLARQPARLDK